MKKALVILLFLTIFVSSLVFTGSVKASYVNGYYRSSGTYVEPYYRSRPNAYTYDNYSYRSPSYSNGYGYNNSYYSGRSYSSNWYSPSWYDSNYSYGQSLYDLNDY